MIDLRKSILPILDRPVQRVIRQDFLKVDVCWIIGEEKETSLSDILTVVVCLRVGKHIRRTQTPR